MIELFYLCIWGFSCGIDGYIEIYQYSPVLSYWNPMIDDLTKCF